MVLTERQSISGEELRDKNGNKLGEYNADDNVTRDRNGNRIGTGHLLMTLLRP